MQIVIEITVISSNPPLKYNASRFPLQDRHTVVNIIDTGVEIDIQFHDVDSSDRDNSTKKDSKIKASLYSK